MTNRGYKAMRSHRNSRRVLLLVPLASVVCVVLSRTAFHSSRYEHPVFGFGIWLELAYVIAVAFPKWFHLRPPEESELQTLNLGG